jgi:hypothetical protein
VTPRIIESDGDIFASGCAALVSPVDAVMGAVSQYGALVERPGEGARRAMKTAKEWAESVVTYLHGTDTWDPALKDEKDFVILESSEDIEGPYAREVIADGRVIIERLVERVQADARAPLEKEIVKLRIELDTWRCRACDGDDI